MRDFSQLDLTLANKKIDDESTLNKIRNGKKNRNVLHQQRLHSRPMGVLCVCSLQQRTKGQK